LYIRLSYMVGVASRSTLYSPRGVKKLDSLMSFGYTPWPMRIIHRNLLMSSPE